VNNEVERMWKGAVVAEFELLSRYLPGATEKDYKRRQTGNPSPAPCLNQGPSEF
jgi:hypothetical protein